MEKVSIATHSDRAYQLLKDDIVHGSHAPGTRLAVRRISEAYQIGASPIREALHRLAGEGLVDAIGQRGFRVPPISTDNLLDVTRTRIMLETEALRQSLRNGDDIWESRVVASFYQLSKVEEEAAANFQEWDRRNQAYHQALVAGCDSRWLHRLRGILYDQHRRYRFLSAHSNSSHRNVSEEHAALLDAALRRDEDAATQVLTAHIELTASVVMEILLRLEADTSLPCESPRKVQTCSPTRLGAKS